MQAESWVSLFVVRDTGRADRPGGLYAAAYVDYRDGSVLTYGELLVARLTGRHVRITDIWVDSPASMAGGRALWAIPKQLADLTLRDGSRGPVSRTTFEAAAAGAPIADATFTSVPGAALVRTPFAAQTAQERSDRTPVVTPLSGSARGLPCLGTWHFDPDGPLAFLHGRRPVLSLRLRDVRLRFG
jgi:acetoacetate decarboxylase